MKDHFLISLVALLIMSTVNAQGDKQAAVKKVVEDFFAAFHAQDSVRMKGFVMEGAHLQTTGRNKEGKTIFKTTPMGTFYRSIASIPDSVSYTERLTSWNIQLDRTMANAWVGYEFWLDGNFSHCGINSFQLVDFDGEWKIVYLIDTRGKSGCSEE